MSLDLRGERVLAAISVAVTIVYEEVPQLPYSLTPAPFTLVGLPLGIFLGLRNNTAYDRFWEGRTLWGALVNTSRSLTRQLLTLVEPQADAEVGPDTAAEIQAFERSTPRAGELARAGMDRGRPLIDEQR